MNTIEQIEQEEIEKLTEGKNIPEFGSGDTVRVQVRVVEGNRERLQAFEGVCIARSNQGLNSSFTLRKISYGEGVERGRQGAAWLEPRPPPPARSRSRRCPLPTRQRDR